MQIPEIFELIIGFFPYGFIYLVTVVALLMYLVFAFVIVQQVNLMSRVVDTKLTPVLQSLALVHLLATIATLALAVLSL